MAATITGKLNKAATIFAAGESTGFGIRLGVQYYDRETKQKEWTNYKAVIFAKAPAQIAFYQQALVEGSIVSVTGKTQKIDVYAGTNGDVISIELLDASIDYIGTLGAPKPAQGGYGQQAPAQQGYGGQPQQAPQLAPQQGYNQAPNQQQQSMQQAPTQQQQPAQQQNMNHPQQQGYNQPPDGTFIDDTPF